MSIRTATLGLVYPEPGDHTRIWEHIQALAESIDAIVVTQTDTVTVDWLPLSGNLSRANGPFVFQVPFVAPPTVTISTGNGYRIGYAEEVTATGGLVKVFDIRAAATGSFDVTYRATGLVEQT